MSPPGHQSPGTVQCSGEIAETKLKVPGDEMITTGLNRAHTAGRIGPDCKAPIVAGFKERVY